MRRRDLLRHWLVAPIAFFLVVAGWALTSPVGSAPDDDYHLSSIWCAFGDRDGRCVDAGDPAVRMVPTAVVRASECYQFKPQVSAACAIETLDDPRLTPTDRVNEIAGLYPGGFYSVMGVFVGEDIEQSVYLMRLFNAALGALLLAALLRLTPAGTAAAGALAIVVSFTPLGFSVVGSTNPSSWTILGVGTVWAFAWSWLRRERSFDRRGVLLLVLVLLTSAMAIASRVDASAYLVFALVLAVTLAGWRRTLGLWPRLLLLAAISIVAAFSYLTHSPIELIGIADEGSALGGANADISLLLRNISDLPQLWIGIVGNWPLGWYDVVMPGLVPVAGALVVGMLIMRGLSTLWPRKSVVVAMSGAAMVVVPLYFLQSQRLVVGEMVQPRYLVPLLTLFLAMLLIGPRASRPLVLNHDSAWVIGTMLSLSAVLAFWTNAHRYMHGNEVGRFDFGVVPAWQPVVPMPMTFAVVALASAVLVIAVVVRAVSRPLAR